MSKELIAKAEKYDAFITEYCKTRTLTPECTQIGEKTVIKYRTEQEWIEDGNTTARNIGGMLSLTQAGIQELIEENEKLKLEISKMKEDINYLKSKIK